MAISSKLHSVWAGKSVHAMLDETGGVGPMPVFVKVGQNAGWFMTREEALELAQELADAVNKLNAVQR